jgi:hypothetical protein
MEQAASGVIKQSGDVDPFSLGLEQLQAMCPLPLLKKQMKAEIDRVTDLTDGNGSGSVEMSFLAEYLLLNSTKDFQFLKRIYTNYVLRSIAYPVEEPVALPVKIQEKPNKTGYKKGNNEQLNRLSRLYSIDIEVLRMAQERGFLVFKDWIEFEVYGITDRSNKALEMCRLDGELFPATSKTPARFSHTIKNSDDSWPVGIMEAKNYPMILLLDGIPDFLAAFHVIKAEGAVDRVAPVAMVSAYSSISEAALPYFHGKHVRIVPHLDSTGDSSSQIWGKQLLIAGAATVDKVDLTSLAPLVLQKDLSDIMIMYKHGIEKEPMKWSILR